ncbi:MAG TPA: hypothetical protein VGH03_21790 [Caulobacteraceae bacterium]
MILPWLLVLASGVYHGANPAMGWPLAVSAGLMGRGWRDLVSALGLLALGHGLAMAGLLLPFSLLTILVQWSRQIRIGAALLVIAFGLWLLVRRRHPRFLAHIRPTQLALWSFAIAMAHGAGLMLLPIYLGLCSPHAHPGAALIGGRLAMALAVSAAHTAAMILTGGALAALAYFWLGPRLIPHTFLNLDRLWASTLMAVGGVALAFAL